MMYLEICLATASVGLSLVALVSGVMELVVPAIVMAGLSMIPALVQLMGQ